MLRRTRVRSADWLYLWNQRWADLLRPAFEEYHSHHGHLDVPQKYSVAQCNLGVVVRNIRYVAERIHVKRHPERLAWLDAHGWREASTYDPMVDPVLELPLQWYGETHGLVLHMPADFVVPEGLPGAMGEYGGLRLGARMHGKMSKGSKRTPWIFTADAAGAHAAEAAGDPALTPDARAFSAALSNSDRQWEGIVRPALDAFYAANGHVNVPQNAKSPGCHLGRVVQQMKQRRSYLVGHPERLRWLDERGWTEMTVYDGRKDPALDDALQWYANRHGGLLSMPADYVMPAPEEDPEAPSAFAGVHLGRRMVRGWRAGGAGGGGAEGAPGQGGGQAAAGPEEHGAEAPAPGRQGRTWAEARAERAALEWFAAQYGHSDVRSDYVLPEAASVPPEVAGLPLGALPRQPRRAKPRGELRTVTERWQAVRSALEWYYEQYGDLAVPLLYIVPAEGAPEGLGGLRLGRACQKIRLDGAFLDGKPEREAWLAARGGVGASGSGARKGSRTLGWDHVQRALQWFHDAHGHLRVEHRFVVPRGVEQLPALCWGLPLGLRVVAMRRRRDYLIGHPERLRWLDERGWAESSRYNPLADPALAECWRWWREHHGDEPVPRGFILPNSIEETVPGAGGLRFGDRVWGDIGTAEPPRRPVEDARMRLEGPR